MASLTEEQAEELCWDWAFWARQAQKLPMGEWLTWLIVTGRGWGKTRTGAETIRQWVCGETPLGPGQYRRIALIAETAADARDVMVEGESGILAVHPKAFKPLYEPSKRRLTWPNGAVASLFNATEPDQLRGPQFDAAWSDELAKWQYARETWDMLQFGLRLGDHPRQIVTTTPRPIAVLKEIMAAATTVMVRGSTKENRGNLAPSFLRQITARYEGTRLGRQELEAEVLDDNPNALWTRGMVDAALVKACPELTRVVVAVDPSGTDGSDEGDDIGVVAAGLGVDGIVYVLSDLTCQESPDGWGRVAVQEYHKRGADRIVGERNFGGAMVAHVIRSVDKAVAYKDVVASRGKWLRAEPVSALYEQGRVKHVGSLPKLEDEMCAFGPDGKADGKSPNRLDALVWAVTELMLSSAAAGVISHALWQRWAPENYPSCQTIIASLSTAYTQESKDPTPGLTIWGTFKEKDKPCVMLLYAWEGAADLSALAKTVTALCSPAHAGKELPAYPVDRLIVETRAASRSISFEIGKLCGNIGGPPVELVDVAGWGDQVARLNEVKPLFTAGMVYAPKRAFASSVISQIALTPDAPRHNLANATTLCLKYLRDTGLLLRQEEQERETAEQLTFRGRERPLYG